MALCRGLTKLQSDRLTRTHCGKWMKAAGYVISVTPWHSGVGVAIAQSTETAETPSVLMFGKGEQTKLEMANLGDVLVAVGKIFAIERNAVTLEECEVLSITTPAEPIALFAEPDDTPLALFVKEAQHIAVGPAPVERNAGGRAPKDYWEDVIIAVMLQWWRGDLKPKRKADVQEAMQDWLSDQGEKWSETPVKERAAKVFAAIQAAEREG